MIKKVVFLAVFSLSSLLILSFCGKKKSEWQGEIYESDEVKIIRNPKKPMYDRNVLDLELELSIGGKDVPKEEYMFTNIKEICVDDQENFYILDPNQKSIKKFNRKGEFLFTIGRSGQGPGEYGWPWDICLSSNELAVLDIIYRRIIFYSLDGVYIKHLNTFKKGQPFDIKMNSNQEFIVYTLGYGQQRTYQLIRFNADFIKIDVIDSFKRDKLPILESISPNIHWCLSKKDEIIWGYSDRYEIKIQNAQGKLTTRILRNYDPVPVDEKEYAEQIKIKFGGRAPGPQFQQKLPKFHPAFHSLLSDDKGRIYIGVFDKTEDNNSTYDILDAEGRYLAKMQLQVTPFLFKKGKLYSLKQDPEGYLVICRYKMKWKNI
jgi:hypothetical protein